MGKTVLDYPDTIVLPDNTRLDVKELIAGKVTHPEVKVTTVTRQDVGDSVRESLVWDLPVYSQVLWNTGLVFKVMS